MVLVDDVVSLYSLAKRLDRLEGRRRQTSCKIEHPAHHQIGEALFLLLLPSFFTITCAPLIN